MPRESLCLKVPKWVGENAIALADRLKLRDKQLKIEKEIDFVCIPLLRKLKEEEFSLFSDLASPLGLETRLFQERELRQKNLVQVLANSLKPCLLEAIPRSLDIVGDIAIMEIPSELKPSEKLVGEAVLNTHKNVRTVLAKAGAVSGTYRLREFNVIAGEGCLLTIHREFGCRYYVDVSKAYFSPRLSHEHERIASLVQKIETIVDLFAGVGPFSILIAKHNAAVKVYAIDINSEAVELLKKNILLNRVEDRVFPLFGDARAIVVDKVSGIADRVIMNLPESASEFVDVACEALKPGGGVVHFYGFVRRPDSVEAMKLRFARAVEESGRKVLRFLFAKFVRETAPYQWQVVLDAFVV